MKTLTVCFCVLLTIHGVLMDQSNSSESTVESFKAEFWGSVHELEKQVDVLVEGMCRTTVGGKAAYKKFVQAREELERCLTNIANENFELPSQVCKEKRLLVRSCFDAAVPSLTKCFDDDTKWLIRDFTIGSINSVFDYFCEDIFDSLKELMSLEGFDCLTNMAKNEIAVDNSTDKCLIKAFSSENEDIHNFSKPVFCDGLKTIKSCVSKSIREQCSTNNGLLHIYQGFMDAFLKFCE